MKNWMFVFAGVLALGGLAGTASAMTIVDFDSFSNNQVLAPGTFDALGVRFNENLGVRANSAQGTLPGSAPNAALNVDSFGGDITGFFLGPVTSVDFISVFAGDVGGDTDTVTLNGFNAANVLVDTSTFTAIAAQTLSISGPGIVSFTIVQSGGIGIDDFTFNPEGANGVPEPVTAALGLMGLGVLSMATRRRVA